jgi:hypothetical protein
MVKSKLLVATVTLKRLKIENNFMKTKENDEVTEGRKSEHLQVFAICRPG